MKPIALASIALCAASLFDLVASGCGGGSSATLIAGSDSGSTVDAAVVVADGAARGEDSSTEDSSSSPTDAGAPVSVTFSYAPQWDGVKKVEVVGGFGMSTDWSKTESLVSLAHSSAGWSGSATLPPGTYLYLFRVTGDALAANPVAYQRYALDPLQSAFAACPTSSPTYSKLDANPCSQLTVTASGGPTPGAPVHVKGTVMLDGAPASGWMVWLEREEPKSHHFFVNRVTTGAGGGIDLVGSAGTYRLQIQYPTLLSTPDLDRTPASLNALRRAISGAFELGAADVTVPTPDVGFHDYDLFAPSGDGGTLPTAFAFESGEARLDVYGGPGDGGVVDIGDPWYSSALTTYGGATFGGVFNTAQAMQDAAVPGTRYMWGTEQPFDVDAGVTWTNQSMVLPIAWGP